MAFYNTVTNRAGVDAAGSTNDKIFASAVLLSTPDPVVKQYNLMPVYEVTGQADSIDVPVFSNFELSWTNLSGTGSDTGSDATITTTPVASYRTITPVWKTGAISVHEAVDLLTNEANFGVIAELAGKAVSKEVDRIAIVNGIFSTEVTQNYSAGGFVANGSVNAGSTLTPNDLEDAKAFLMAGSVNSYYADSVVLGVAQYNQLKKHADFKNQNYNVLSKATMQGGEIIEYAGMKIVPTQLIPSLAGSPTTVNVIATTARKVAVFDSRVAFAMAQKTAGFKVRSQLDIMKHINLKVFDIFVEAKCLVPGAVVHILASN